MSLKETPRTDRRNVVLIHLESTRARSVTPYNEDLKATPFLDELAKGSLLAERVYTTVPHTSKATISVNCGIQPHLVEEITEARQGGIPSALHVKLDATADDRSDESLRRRRRQASRGDRGPQGGGRTPRGGVRRRIVLSFTEQAIGHKDPERESKAWGLLSL